MEHSPNRSSSLPTASAATFGALEAESSLVLPLCFTGVVQRSHLERRSNVSTAFCAAVSYCYPTLSNVVKWLRTSLCRPDLHNYSFIRDTRWRTRDGRCLETIFFNTQHHYTVTGTAVHMSRHFQNRILHKASRDANKCRAQVRFLLGVRMLFLPDGARSDARAARYQASSHMKSTIPGSTGC